MKSRDAQWWSRREFLGGMTLAGTAGLLGVRPELAAAEPPPETREIKLFNIGGVCVAPQYLAEELLKGEQFDHVQYVKIEVGQTYTALASGQADISIAFVAPFIVQVDKGLPIVLLAGIHVGCYEVFGTDRVRAIRDLKGKSVAVPSLGSPHHVFLASMVAYVGLDPGKDINWVTHAPADAMRLLAERKIDALVGFPPVPQELRARKIGHVIVSSAADRPWSQYFCCIAAANRDFARKHPIATKRALRAMLKATDLCAQEPDRAAKMLVEKGFTERYEYALQSMKDVPYNRWREYDPEDTVRFYSLRLHEAGMIKSIPQKIIAQGTDWRFFNELKRELKG